MERNRERIENEAQAEREEYIKLRERVDVAVGLIASGEFISKENILRVIGTESALKAADKIRDAENKKDLAGVDVIGYDCMGKAVDAQV